MPSITLAVQASTNRCVCRVTNRLLWVENSFSFSSLHGKLVTSSLQSCSNSIRVESCVLSTVEHSGPIRNPFSLGGRYGNLGPVGELGRLCKEGRLNEAFEFVDLLEQRGTPVSRDIIYCLLQGCNKIKNLQAARRVHSLMVNSGLDSIPVLGDHLIRLFSSCGSLLEANKVFCNVLGPSIYTWNSIISAHANLGEGERALELFYTMQGDGVTPDKVTFLCILKACSYMGGTAKGRLVHELITRSGCESDVAIGNTLVHMYAKCGSLREAQCVFDHLPNPDIVSWCVMITGHAIHNHGSLALEIFERMQQAGMLPSRPIYLCTLKVCGSIGNKWLGRLIHHQLMKTEFVSDVIVGTALLDMYAKCGSLQESHHVFDKMCNHNIASCGTILAGYVQHGHGLKALELFEKMSQEGLKPDNVIFSCVLKACSSKTAIEQGRQIHEQITRSGLELDVILQNTLIDMYAKCRSLREAQKVFDDMRHRDVVSWAAMIGGYTQQGYGRPALKLFENMQEEHIKPDNFIFSCSLSGCANAKAICEGRLIHEYIIRRGFESDVVVGSSLVDMYAECGNLDEAYKVFDNLQNRNVISWGTIIVAYIQHGLNLHALELFGRLQGEGLQPEAAIFSYILKASGNIGDIRPGRLIHTQIIKTGLSSDLVVGNSLIDLYSKCGSLEEAKKWFDMLPNCDVGSWDAMLTGYAQHGHCRHVFQLFSEMQEEGIEPSEITFLCILKACGSTGDIEQGRQTHNQIMDRGLESDVVVGSTLIDMYAKCENLKDAHNVFDNLKNRNIVSWGALIAGYAQIGHGLAFKLYDRMQQEGITPDKHIYSSMLKACCSMGAIRQGKVIHDQVVKTGSELDIVVGSSLVDMYAKCGNLVQARQVFNTLPSRSLVSWGAMIAGYTQFCKYIQALQCLEGLQRQGLKPDGLIFSSIISVCSHAGLLGEGHSYFKSMILDYGITPSIEHYNCMVDLLGRAGHLHEADDFIQSMPLSPDSIVWTSLLTNCRTYCNTEVGRQCFHEISRLAPNNASGYVLLSNIFAEAHIQENIGKISELKHHVHAWKKPGRAWIEVDKLYEFIVGDNSYSHCEQIYHKLKTVRRLMKVEGYMPEVDFTWILVTSEDCVNPFREHCEEISMALKPVCVPGYSNKIHLCTVSHNGCIKSDRHDFISRDSHAVYYLKDGVPLLHRLVVIAADRYINALNYYVFNAIILFGCYDC